MVPGGSAAYLGPVESPHEVRPFDSEAPRDSAGVRVPPPLYYVVGYAVGWGLERWTGWSLFPESAAPSVWLAPGIALLAVGVALGVSAVWVIRRAGSSIVPVRPTTALVTGGPFRVTRNPMYLGLAMCYAGIAVSFNALWPLLVLPFVVRVVRRRVIGREERYLERTFGRVYRRYVERVPRWI